MKMCLPRAIPVVAFLSNVTYAEHVTDDEVMQVADKPTILSHQVSSRGHVSGEDDDLL